MKMKIGVDIDSVVCELMPTVMKHINQKTKKKNTVNDVTNWNMKFGNEDLFENIVEVLDTDRHILNFPVVEDSQWAIKWMLKQKHEIMFITSRRDRLKANTKKWIEKNFGNFEVYHTGPEENKNGYEVDVLIDDSPQHITRFAEGGGKAIVFDRPWNRDIQDSKNIYRGKDWAEITVILFFIKLENSLENYSRKWKERMKEWSGSSNGV